VSVWHEIRPLIVLQLALLVVVSVVFFLHTGIHAAGAVWFGGMTAVLNAGLLHWRRHRAAAGRALSAGQSLRLLYRTALERFVLVMVLFALGLGVLELAPLALVSGFVAGQLALILMGLKG
jgi:ATP synthase protein I